jgi:hypothetical protein
MILTVFLNGVLKMNLFLLPLYQTKVALRFLFSLLQASSLSLSVVYAISPLEAPLCAPLSA